MRIDVLTMTIRPAKEPVLREGGAGGHGAGSEFGALMDRIGDQSSENNPVASSGQLQERGNRIPSDRKITSKEQTSSSWNTTDEVSNSGFSPSSVEESQGLSMPQQDPQSGMPALAPVAAFQRQVTASSKTADGNSHEGHLISVMLGSLAVEGYHGHSIKAGTAPRHAPAASMEVHIEESQAGNLEPTADVESVASDPLITAYLSSLSVANQATALNNRVASAAPVLQCGLEPQASSLDKSAGETPPVPSALKQLFGTGAPPANADTVEFQPGFESMEELPPVPSAPKELFGTGVPPANADTVVFQPGFESMEELPPVPSAHKELFGTGVPPANADTVVFQPGFESMEELPPVPSAPKELFGTGAPSANADTVVFQPSSESKEELPPVRTVISASADAGIDSFQPRLETVDELMLPHAAIPAVVNTSSAAPVLSGAASRASQSTHWPDLFKPSLEGQTDFSGTSSNSAAAADSPINATSMIPEQVLKQPSLGNITHSDFGLPGSSTGSQAPPEVMPAVASVSTASTIDYIQWPGNSPNEGIYPQEMVNPSEGFRSAAALVSAQPAVSKLSGDSSDSFTILKADVAMLLDPGAVSAQHEPNTSSQLPAEPAMAVPPSQAEIMAARQPRASVPAGNKAGSDLLDGKMALPECTAGELNGSNFLGEREGYPPPMASPIDLEDFGGEPQISGRGQNLKSEDATKLRIQPPLTLNSGALSQNPSTNSDAEASKPVFTAESRTEKETPQSAVPSRGLKAASPELPTVSSPSVPVSQSLGEGKLASMQPPAAQNPAVEMREFIAQLSDRIQVQLRDGGNTIRIQLRPESLGHLEIRAENAINGVVARIITESGDVKHYLENNLQVLQQNLQDRGLKVERIEVIVQEGFDSRQSSLNQGFNNAGSGQRGEGATAASEMSNSRQPILADDVVIDTPSIRVLGPNSTFHTVA